MYKFKEAGTYRLLVHCSNALGSASVESLVYVQPSLNSIQVDSILGLKGHPTQFVLEIIGGTDLFTVEANYGDGSTIMRKSIDAEDGFQKTIQEDGQTLYRMQLEHTFTEIGQFNTQFNVSNKVSSIQESKVILVEEPITGLVVTSKVPSVVPILQDVTAVATIETGSNVSFKWDFGERFGHARTQVDGYVFIFFLLHSSKVAIKCSKNS